MTLVHVTGVYKSRNPCQNPAGSQRYAGLLPRYFASEYWSANVVRCICPALWLSMRADKYNYAGGEGRRKGLGGPQRSIADSQQCKYAVWNTSPEFRDYDM